MSFFFHPQMCRQIVKGHAASVAVPTFRERTRAAPSRKMRFVHKLHKLNIPIFLKLFVQI